MEINDIELNNKLGNINKQIEEALKTSHDRLNQKIITATKELKKKIGKKKFENMKDFRDEPLIKLKLDLNYNYIVNPIMLMLANLKVITKFIYSKKSKEILIGLNELGIEQQNFIKYFIALMLEMRDKNNISQNFAPIHQYFHSYTIYKSQEPYDWFKFILEQIESNINLVDPNDINNIITKNFSLILNNIEKCNVCFQYEKIISKEKVLVANLTLFSQIPYTDELNNIFKNFLIGEKEESQTKHCPRCSSFLSLSKTLYKTSKYLVINLDRKKDPNKNMKLSFKENLKIADDYEKKEYEYELLSALTGININLSYVENMNKIVLFIKNYIKNVWYRLNEGKYVLINENISEIIKDQNPNILIYKRLK